MNARPLARDVDVEEEDLQPAADGELFARVGAGDLGALGELFDRHHASVRGFAERLLGSRADAEDLVQETFLTASRAASSFDPAAPAKPFLLGVAAQLARRRRRSFARLRAMLQAFGSVPVEARATPEDEVARTEDAARLDAALARLSHAHREVVLLVDLGGLSGVEAARSLDVPVGTVWRRLHEARNELRARLARRPA